ncbi:MAG: chromosome partitioning protein ParB [Blastopirellula sp.]|nr:MAG: chromosome partitioning protein ParB [Blastopirellula sp.]
MTKQKRLGRGLAALLGGPIDEQPISANTPTPVEEPTLPRVYRGEEETSTDTPIEIATPADSILRLNVHEIDDNPFQPRREFNESEIVSLAESLKEHDMLQPIVVRVVDGRYQLISGERRLRASIHAGWTEIPAQVREADDRLVAELAIVENLQRKDLNPIEKALSFHRYIQEHNCTQGDLSKRIKIDRSTIANLMRLLELPEAIKSAVVTGKLTAGHARALLPLGDEPLQLEFSQRIETEGLSVRAVERAVSEFLQDEDEGPTAVEKVNKSKKSRTTSTHIESLEQELKMTLGTKVAIQQSGKGGKISIQFKNEAEFERIFDQLQGTTGDLRKAS